MKHIGTRLGALKYGSLIGGAVKINFRPPLVAGISLSPSMNAKRIGLRCIGSSMPLRKQEPKETKDEKKPPLEKNPRVSSFELPGKLRFKDEKRNKNMRWAFLTVQGAGFLILAYFSWDYFFGGDGSVVHADAQVKNSSFEYKGKDVKSKAAVEPLPQTIKASTGSGRKDFVLVGLGIRYVTFLKLHTYVLGIYMTQKGLDDLKKAIAENPNAKLGSEELDAIMKKSIASNDIAALIVPIRPTDLPHFRDGFLRSIQRRKKSLKEAGQEESPETVKSMEAETEMFRDLFPRGKAKKNSRFLIIGDRNGDLEMEIDGEKLMSWTGKQQCPCTRQLIFEFYLTGKDVASEEARDSVLENLGVNK